jgi:hypothetical protein
LKDEVRDAKDASEKAPSAVMAALVDKLRADQVLIPPKITNIGLHIFVITKAPTYSEAKRNHFRTKMTTLGSRIFDLVFFGGGGSDPLCLSSSSALHFFRLFFLAHFLVNQDDQHLLAHAMASDFSVDV